MLCHRPRKPNEPATRKGNRTVPYLGDGVVVVRCPRTFARCGSLHASTGHKRTLTGQNLFEPGSEYSEKKKHKMFSVRFSLTKVTCVWCFLDDRVLKPTQGLLTPGEKSRFTQELFTHKRHALVFEIFTQIDAEPFVRPPPTNRHKRTRVLSSSKNNRGTKKIQGSKSATGCQHWPCFSPTAVI